MRERAGFDRNYDTEFDREHDNTGFGFDRSGSDTSGYDTSGFDRPHPP